MQSIVWKREAAGRWVGLCGTVSFRATRYLARDNGFGCRAGWYLHVGDQHVKVLPSLRVLKEEAERVLMPLR